MKKKNSKTKASSSIEFLFIYIVLFLIFIGIIDFALFFRQIYLVQTISDEALSRLVVENTCEDRVQTSSVLAKVLNDYFGAKLSFTYEFADNVHIYSSDNYTFNLYCINPSTPDMLSFSRKYSGLLFFYGSHNITSNFSSNTSLY